MARVIVHSTTNFGNREFIVDDEATIGKIRADLGAELGITPDMTASVDNAQVTNTYVAGIDDVVEFRPSQKQRGN